MNERFDKLRHEKRNGLDNAMADKFFGILKTELQYAQEFGTAEDYVIALGEIFIDLNSNRVKV